MSKWKRGNDAGDSAEEVGLEGDAQFRRKYASDLGRQISGIKVDEFFDSRESIETDRIDSSILSYPPGFAPAPMVDARDRLVFERRLMRMRWKALLKHI